MNETFRVRALLGLCVVCLALPSEAADRIHPGQWVGTTVVGGRTFPSSSCISQADADAMNAAGRAEEAARKSLDVSRHQLELGAVSYLALLSAQQAYQQAVISLLQARANRLTDTAALFQALGGLVTPAATQ